MISVVVTHTEYSSTTMGAQQQGGISKVVDKQFDEAYNITLVEGGPTGRSLGSHRLCECHVHHHEVERMAVRIFVIMSAS